MHPRRRFLLGSFLLLPALRVSAAGTAKARSSYLVGFSQDTLANDWRAAQVRALQKGFAQHPNVRFIHTDGQGKTARQVQDIEDLAARGVDVLITSPRDAELMAPVIAAVHKRGVPVVLVTRGIASDGYTTLVGPDDAHIARDAAQFIAKRLDGRGRVFMLRGVPTASTAVIRARAFTETLGNYPGLRIVATRDGNYLRADALRATEDTLATGTRFDALYAHSDSMASGARLALERANINPASIVSVGIDYISEAREAIRQGTQTASFTYPFSAQETVDTVMRILRGETVERRVVVASQLVTRDNVEQTVPIY